MDQQEITKWEVENKDSIIGWTIIYGKEFDTIIFKLNDDSKKEFQRINDRH